MSWTDSWVFYIFEKISFNSSDLLLIISVWNPMTYLATSNETSLDGGIDSLELKKYLLDSGSEIWLEHEDLLSEASFHQGDFTLL